MLMQENQILAVRTGIWAVPLEPVPVTTGNHDYPFKMLFHIRSLFLWLHASIPKGHDMDGVVVDAIN